MGAEITQILMPKAPAIPDPMNNHVPDADIQYFNKHIDDGQLVALFNEDTSTAIRFNLCINQFTHKGLISLPNANLLNLKELMMNNNAIGGLGCKYISRAKMPNLKRLCLDTCSIGSTGMLHLSKGNWNSLIEISLVKNNISRNGSAWLTKTKWWTEILIFLTSNEMNILEMLLFLFCPDEYLKRVDLRCHKEAEKDLQKMRAWMKLRKTAIKSKILI